MPATRFLLPSTRLFSRAAIAAETTSIPTLTQISRSRAHQSTSLYSHKSSFHTSPPSKMANRTVESDMISEITQKEKDLTGQAQPVKGGPTAQAQRHVHEKLSDGSVLSDIAKGEETITHNGAPVAGGPAAAAQSHATQAGNEENNPPQTHTGKLDSQTISEINAAEKELTGQSAPVKGGPTAQAQKHAGEPINSSTLHDITEGEKAVAGDRVKGGPTATAQSELAKSRRS